MKYIYSILITSQMLLANCMTQNSNITMGECYEQEGNINRAQAAYERALLEDDTNVQARIKLAQLYQTLSMHTSASAVLADVNENQLTPQQRTTLSTLRPQESHAKPQLHAKVTLSGGYDSNINISPQDLPSNPTLEATATLFSRLNADLSYLHALDSTQNWFVRGDFNLHYQNNEAAHYYDALYGRLYTGFGYQNSAFSLYVPLFYDQLHYLDRNLLEEYGVRPDANIRLSNTLIVNLNASYTARRYLNTQDRLRNDDLLSGGLGLYYLENSNVAYLKTHYENYQSVRDNAPAFIDKTMLYLKLGGIYSLKEIMDVKLDYQYRQGDFKAFLGTKRDDDNHDIAFALEKDLMTHFRLSAKYHYITNDSNIEQFNYYKHEMLLALTYNY